jgi:tetratricopeptide (TPR) repeat protein
MKKRAKLTKTPLPGGLWLPGLLAVVCFLVYWPSLGSDFVYDARTQIIEEGYVRSLARLPEVLSLHVLSMNLILGSRPGELLYLMINAALWGEKPWGYHLVSNFLHAVNVALLLVLLRRLTTTELTEPSEHDKWKIPLALTAVSLFFGLHPLAAETVSEISYSSDLLVTFFTLTALLLATRFRPDDGTALLIGGSGVVCALASVMCKESGLATALLLIVYWFLYRREEPRKPWLIFLGAATVAMALFLAARFAWAPAPSPYNRLDYLGGSLSQVFVIQPRLWVFMMGKLIWPVHLSADYTLNDTSGVTLPLALAALAFVGLFQGWLATKSRMGALGVATYWLGLVTVSNFEPLYRFLADRFYYLPMAGVGMQLLALLLYIRARPEFWMLLCCCFVALLPMTLLTLLREEVFASDAALWTDTVEESPYSSLSHYNLGNVYLRAGKPDEAWAEYQKTIALKPRSASPYNTMGVILAQKGRLDEARIQFERALELNPDFADAHGNLGLLLARQGKTDEAIVEFKKVLAFDPDNANAHNNLGAAYFDKGEMKEAIAQFQEALRLEPDNRKARKNLEDAENKL